MSVLDQALLAERAMAVERHLRRVADRLPASPQEMAPATDVSDAVILHFWQATQIVIDLAMTACLALKLGTPASYPDAFRRLQQQGVIDAQVAERLVRAAGFRNIVAHAYETLDMARVTRGGEDGTGRSAWVPGDPARSRGPAAVTDPLSPRHLLKPVSSQVKQVFICFGFRSCLSCGRGAAA